MTLPDLPPIDVVPRPAVMLGYDTSDLRRCWSGPEDSVGLVGPPRYGKSSGIIIPTLLTWSGPSVVTSTRGDLLRATGDRRAQLAAVRDGQVLVYDPFESVPGVQTIRWSPLAGCDDDRVAYRRAAAMTAVAGRGVEDADHWRAGASRILRAYFHAAAIAGEPLRTVRGWLAAYDTTTAGDILTRYDSPARFWGADLAAMGALGDRERGSFFSLATDTLEATAQSRVLASCEATDLDVDRFLASGSTLYVVGPSHAQAVIAPLIVGLVDSIAQRAAELAEEAGGRLDPPLLLALDEVANTAPLDSLPQLVSEGGGRGIITMWAAQSLAQLRARYGTDTQQAILTASSCKLIWGGLSNGPDLRDLSTWAGEYRQPTITTAGRPGVAQAGIGRMGGTVGGLGGLGPFDGADPLGVPGRLGDPGESGREWSMGTAWRPALPVEAIQQLPPGYAWLWHKSDAPLLVDTRPAGLVPAYGQMSGYHPAVPRGRT